MTTTASRFPNFERAMQANAHKLSADMKLALTLYVTAIADDYEKNTTDYPGREKMDFDISIGAKFLHIWTNGNTPGKYTRSHSWIVIVPEHTVTKQGTGGSYKPAVKVTFYAGDILKSATYKAPALNVARGNILQGGYVAQWTGAPYVR